ncbi:uncharacterized protein PRCAT00004717001 [Priceomyces carsonii]|uniref:uncharacterized protein n=1 Tax=Priceomyces carsonii TaxID=28549 RepID=UPI002ED8CBDC|nr:unnamed protein product [Priceomyces carsonii]
MSIENINFQKGEEGEQNGFWKVVTPLKGRVDHDQSPTRRTQTSDSLVHGTKSPRKRGIIRSTTEKSMGTSPVKTPNGRAGLPSPEKRTIDDLNKSARKRAIGVTSKYHSLMDEDLEYDSDYLNNQDRSLAEIIIKESRDESNGFHYGSDVELEEDITESVRKRRNRRRESSEKEKKLEAAAASDDELSSDEEYTPRRRRKREVLDNISSPTETPKKKVHSKALGRPKVKEAVEKRKVGRPSKSDEVIGKVKSIFQLDDEDLFMENKDKPKSPSQNQDRVDTEDSYPTFSFNETTCTPPIISGIQEEKVVPKKEGDLDFFKPMPIPKVDSNGDIVDEEFEKKYIPINQIKSRGSLIDERSFFLDGSEGYFEQHSTRPKYSTNSLSQLAPQLDYDEFIPYVQLSELIKANEKRSLSTIHKSLYNQWCFELSQGYNLNFFGIGSKIKLILDFVQSFVVDWYENVLDSDGDSPNILVVNGYNPTLKFKRILQDIVTAFISQEERKSTALKFPKHVSETLPFLVNFIETTRDDTCYSGSLIKPKLILVVHNIDGEALRDEKTQSFLSELCSLPEIWLISSTDNINVSLLWDSVKLKNFNFLWHDLTTYEPYNVELSFKDVLSLGKSKKYVGNKGAKYVLTSLTNNARNLYKILLQKQKELISSIATTKTSLLGLRGNAKFAIDFNSLYNTCVEEFITSNEISFRTILGEFVEHKMCNLTKNESGSEIIFVPFSYEEIEQLLSECFT